MATTTNYGWTTPDDTALVKDGASAIRTLGSSVDTSVKALNPGTTAGDLDYYTAATTKARIAKGTAGQVFTMNSGATAPEWATASSGGMTSIASGTLSTGSVVLSSIAQTYNDLILVVNNPYITASTAVGYVRVNGSTSFIYGRTIINSNNTQETDGVTVLDYIRSIPLSTNTTKYGQVIVRFKNYTSTTSLKLFDYQEFENINSPARLKTGIGGFSSQSAITSITFGTDASTFAGGTYVLYGVK